ncbi:hypothetical protein Tco_1136312 [Tanacetum coccineum]
MDSEKESKEKAKGRMKRKTSKASEDKNKRQKTKDDPEKLILIEYVQVVFDSKEAINVIPLAVKSPIDCPDCEDSRALSFETEYSRKGQKESQNKQTEHGMERTKSSEAKSEGNKDVKEKDSDDHDKIINLQQRVVLVRQESSVDITPSVVKAPIYDWKIFKDKPMEVYHIFRVGQAPKANPYFEAMLKEFVRINVFLT